MQLLLARRGMDGLLTYDIWITREPTLNERELNTRLQACLVSSKTRSDVDYDVQKAKSNDSYADITKIHRRNQIVSLEHGMHDVSQQFAFSLGSNEPVSDNRGAESSTSAGMFDFFYSHAQMHTGIRPSRNKLRIMCAASANTLDPNEAKDYPVPSTLSSSVITVKSIDPKPTLVLLNTSVGRLRVDVERLAASHGFDLLTDDFWS